MPAVSPRWLMVPECLFTIVVLVLAASAASAQNANDIGTPAESKTGQSTASTYAMDKIETVNLVNGNMSLHIPLASIGGRGSAGFTIALSYNSKLWSPEHNTEVINAMAGNLPPVYIEHYRATFDDFSMRTPGVIALGGGWTVLPAPTFKTTVVNIDPLPPGSSCTMHNESGPPCGYRYALTKMWLMLPDGSEIEFSDDLTNGAPALTPNQNGYHPATDRDRGRVWHSTDGSGVVYVIEASGTGSWVFFPDGTRYHMLGGSMQIIDRNGNFVNIDYGTQNPGYTTYTDTLGRRVLMASSDATVTVKGYGGVPDRTITLDVAAFGALDGSGVASNLRADFRTLQRPFYSGDFLRTEDNGYTYHTDPSPHTDLFGGSEGTDGAIDEHGAVTMIHLLDGRNLRFRYNQYGELAEIVYPGGGVSQIDYAAGTSNLCEATPLAEQLNRRVVQRRSLTDGTNVDAVWTYGFGGGTVESVTYPTTTIETRQGSTTGTVLASETHYFLMRDAEYRNCASGGGNGTGYDRWQNAKEFRVERQTGTGTVVERRIWGQRASVVWANDVGLSYNAYAAQHEQEQPPNDPRITVQDYILENGRMKRVEYFYDDFNNVTLTKEYDFGGTDGSLGSLVRQSFRTYGATIGSNYGIVKNGNCYSNLNPADGNCGNGLASVLSSIIYQRHLLSNETTKDAANNQKAYSELEYDNYVADTNHAGLVMNSDMIQSDGTHFSTYSSSYQPRGNVTKATRWAGGSNYISSFSQYDNAGNVVWQKDPKGNLTTVSYADNFGDGSNPDNPAVGTNGATYAFGTLATNALGQQARSQFDYTRGVPTGLKDLNNIISRTEYDLIGRPVRVTAALGLSEQTVAETTYPTATSNFATGSKQLDATHWLASKTILDGFDRPLTSWQAEDGQSASYASFTIRANTIYDALGRVKQISNPYRPASETAVYTTTVYDLAGRVVSVTTPDSAVVSSYYNSNQVLVRDQTGKERMSQSNGLGQLTDVWEIIPAIPADDATEAISFPNRSEVAVGYRTKYGYDTLGNLTTVTQRIGTAGTTQTRSFAYDSLSRLISATNPESATVNYQYDNNGNLQVKTDAREVSSHYEYDALNRVTRRWYNGRNYLTDTTNNVPAVPAPVAVSDEVKYFYDSQNPPGAPTFDRGFASGRLIAVTYGSGSSGNYFGYDALGKPLRSIQQTGGINYETSAIYNLAGAITTETYPSRRTITNTYDGAGRTTSVVGNLGDGTSPRNYATGIVYDAASRMTKEQFGTDTPIFNKLLYNSRGQLSEIRESTSYTGPTDTTWDRGAIINHYSDTCWGMCGGSSSTTAMTDNNGNLKKQEYWIPDNDQLPTTNYHLLTERFEYDQLNRLKRVYEGTNWQQQYSYDRYGNRSINAATNATWGQGINNMQMAVVANTSTNRMYAPGESESNHPTMDYDAAGNQKKDYYTDSASGEGYDRTYDAENRMKTSAATYSNPAVTLTSTYSYDGDGRRVRRNVNGTETWQVYGLAGELLAEYAANAGASSPQKEYGYRNGQLLITADAPARTNVALAANGATASASSTFYNGTSFSPSPAGAIDGEHRGTNYVTTGAWHSATNTFPQWLQVDFNGSKTIDEIDLFSVQDNYSSPSEPTETMTFSLYGLSGFEVQCWNGSAWATVTNGSITGNNKVWRKVNFTAITTSKIRVLTNGSPDNWSRIIEVQAWSGAVPPAANIALSTNGATASASSTFSNGSSFAPSPAGAIDGEHQGSNYVTTGAWHSATNTMPQWVQVDFNGSKTISEIDVFSVQDNYTNPLVPSETMTFSLYGLIGFDVQYWNGSTWVTVPSGSVTGNNLVWKKITFSPLTTSKIRVLTNASPDGYSRIVELEAWGAAAGLSSSSINWLVTDQLGTPRMIFDQSGSLATTSRHDYLPFGEELFAGTAGRTTALGYTNNDGARQKFTQKERDNETGLDYFINRYYSSTQGRFTSVDPTLQSIDPTNPQTLNRYSYALNNPLAFIDPDGLDPLFIGSYDKLTDEQKRLFGSYVQQNYAEELKNPLFTAESLWNSSAAVANGDAAAGPNSRLLNDGQLTNFVGVTKMLEKRGVIDQVASISEIHGDAPEGHTYRIIGELKNNSSAVEAIKKAFPNPIAGKGHGKYSDSDREQGLFGAPNGQVSRVPKETGVDIDVDYRCILCPGHISKGGLGSDIRVGTHYEDARKRYGPMPPLSRTKEELRIRSLY